MLKISRPDVQHDHLQSWGPDRFIKLPIQPYLELLQVGGTSCWNQINNPQIALINAVNSPHYRFITAAYSRRLGKTFIANVLGQLVSLIPGSNVLIMSPNYNLSTISFELQRGFIRQFDLELTRDNVKDRVIELSNSSTIRMGSVNTVDSSVGRSYDLIIFDEAALDEGGESAFNVALRPTLDKPTAKAIFISTPRGKSNWFSKFWTRGYDPRYPSWCSLHADCWENPRMSPTDVDEARSSMSKAEFEQEYLASFNTYEGQIYGGWSQSFVEEVPLASGECFGGLDPGYKDDTAFVVVKVIDGVFWVVAEYVNSEVATSVHAHHIRGLCETWGVETIFIDSANQQFAADLAYNHDISTTNARKDVLAGISHVQNLIDNGKLRVSPGCTHTLEMLDGYSWDNKPHLLKPKPLHNRYSHIADALRYALYSFIY